MTAAALLKTAIIALVLLVLVYALSLFNLYTQIGRYKTYWNRKNKEALNKPVDYVALGDSTAQGIGANRPEKGYVGLIEKSLSSSSGKEINYINLSKTGAKISDALNTQLPEMQKYKTTDNTIITIEIGANDISNFNRDQFEDEMDELMVKLPKQTLISDIPYFGGSRYGSKEKDVETANEIMYKLASKHNFKLVSLHDRMKQNGGIKTLAPDLFHPSNTSYKENWAPAFLERINERN